MYLRVTCDMRSAVQSKSRMSIKYTGFESVNPVSLNKIYRIATLGRHLSTSHQHIRQNLTLWPLHHFHHDSHFSLKQPRRPSNTSKNLVCMPHPHKNSMLHVERAQKVRTSVSRFPPPIPHLRSTSDQLDCRPPRMIRSLLGCVSAAATSRRNS